MHFTRRVLLDKSRSSCVVSGSLPRLIQMLKSKYMPEQSVGTEPQVAAGETNDEILNVRRII